MKMIVLSALFTLGLGMAATSAASAATFGSGLSSAQLKASLVEKAAQACRKVRVCARGPNGRPVCEWRTTCRQG